MDDPLTTASTLAVAPASLGQRQLWLYDRLYGRDGTYNIPFGLRLRGLLDGDALRRSLNEIVRRHEVLRTTFTQEGGELLQVIADELAVPLPVIACDEQGLDAALDAARRQIAADGGAPFDLELGPLLRARLYRLAPDDHVLTIVIHHAVFDGWSIGTLQTELGAFYSAFAAARPALLPDLPIQFADFATWQREQLEGDAFAEALTYWRRQLAGAPLFVALPTDRPRRQLTGRRGCLVRGQAAALRIAVAELSRREGVTLFTVLMAAFALLMHRYSGQDDLLIAVPVAGRMRQELEPLIGFFVNTVLVRSRLHGDPTIREWLADVQASVLDAQSHQEAPFEKVAEIVRTSGAGELPLLQVMLALQSATPQPGGFAGLEVSPFSVHNGTAKSEVFLNVIEDASGLLYEIEADRTLFDEATITRLLQHFETLLGSMAAGGAHRRVAGLTLLGEDERQQLLAWGTGTAAEYPSDQSLATVFEAQARRTPDAMAATCQSRHLSYSELNRRANRLAHLLKAKGVGPDVIVGVALDRSLDLLVALLAIAKAGGAYLPLDTTYPQKRLAFMLAETRAPFVIASRAQAIPLPAVPRLDLDDESVDLSGYPDGDLPAQAAGNDLAYVMYTSGSTGQPKGVAVPHRGVVRLVRGTDYVSWGDVRTMLQMAPVSFDASTFEIWGALLHGARCVLIPDRVVSLGALERTLRSERVDCLWLTAALFNEIIDTRPAMLAGVGQLLVGGEALSVPHVRRALSLLPDTRLVNGYGPTETTTFACCLPIPRALGQDVRSIPIGRPIANSQAYILDARMAVVPIGVEGELYLGGDGVAREYLGQPALTAERFVRDPFGRRPDARVFRTGDRARWLSDGTIEFLGRLDRQVKLHGFRIEPGEIEHALKTAGGVRDAVVELRTDARGRRLVAYVVPSDQRPLSGAALRDVLSERIPGHMIPSEFVFLPELPRTANGKVDRAGLPVPPETIGSPPEVRASRDVVEADLAAIWRDVLKLDWVGPRDNFFEIGGHSLLALRLLAEIEKTWGIALLFSALVEAPTVEQLAARIRIARASNAPSLVVIADAPGPPLVCIHSISGDVVEFRELAQRLGASQGVAGIHAVLTGDVADIYETVESTAAHYVDELRRLQPAGPYYLAGWSAGGITAFEMAQQLRAAGEEVAFLGIIDTSPATMGRPSAGPRLKNLLRLLVNVPRWVRDDLLRSDPTDVWWRVRQKVALVLRTGSARSSKAADGSAPSIRSVLNLPPGSPQWETFLEKHYGALTRYVPRPYDGTITVFKARTHPLFWIHDPEVIWKRLSGDVEVYTLPGTHLTIVREPNLPVLAAAMQEALTKSRAAHGQATPHPDARTAERGRRCVESAGLAQ